VAPRAIAGALAICSLALVSCGGSGEEVSAIEETIVASAKSDDPANCGRLHTQAFLEQSAKLEGRAAVETCEETTVDGFSEDPERVVVFDVDVDGSAATASTRFVGSAYDGQTVRFRLVRRDGDWKLDELLGFVHLDAEKLILGVAREGMYRATSRQEAQFIACVTGLLEEMDDGELEAFFVDYGPDEIRSLAERCISRSQAL
jgi:hypothetical protein